MEGHCHKVWKEGILIFSDCAYRLYDAMAKNFLTTLSKASGRINLKLRTQFAIELLA